MNKLLKIEEAAALILGIYLFSTLHLNWWWFIGLFFVPDLAMLGYVVNAKTGAWCYNFMHLKMLGILLFLAGIFTGVIWLQLAGVVVFAHSAFDRMLGYGLKHESGFKDTHLGKIGK